MPELLSERSFLLRADTRNGQMLLMRATVTPYGVMRKVVTEMGATAMGKGLRGALAMLAKQRGWDKARVASGRAIRSR